jgi:hypothetical protein
MAGSGGELEGRIVALEDNGVHRGHRLQLAQGWRALDVVADVWSRPCHEPSSGSIPCQKDFDLRVLTEFKEP